MWIELEKYLNTELHSVWYRYFLNGACVDATITSGALIMTTWLSDGKFLLAITNEFSMITLESLLEL